MLTSEAKAILDNLNVVAAERRRRRGDAVLDSRVHALKAYQHARFARTYADLLASPRYSRAALFFLDDLYGPRDFTDRDTQFARVVPGMALVFPHEVAATVHSLSELHSLSETLDTQMALLLPTAGVDRAGYVSAWQRVGRPADRQRQIDLMLAVGSALDRYTRSRLLRHSLRLMRRPARAAGLAALQTFLESGFDTFREMGGAAEFLATVASRERALAAALFGTDAASLAEHAPGPLGQLP